MKIFLVKESSPPPYFNIFVYNCCKTKEIAEKRILDKIQLYGKFSSIKWRKINDNEWTNDAGSFLFIREVILEEE